MLVGQHLPLTLVLVAILVAFCVLVLLEAHGGGTPQLTNVAARAVSPFCVDKS